MKRLATVDQSQRLSRSMPLLLSPRRPLSPSPHRALSPSPHRPMSPRWPRRHPQPRHIHYIGGIRTTLIGSGSYPNVHGHPQRLTLCCGAGTGASLHRTTSTSSMKELSRTGVFSSSNSTCSPARRASSCGDVSRGPLSAPRDCWLSESGVSLSGSHADGGCGVHTDEGCVTGVEDAAETGSLRSLGSSSAFHELTCDSEADLDPLDSDGAGSEWGLSHGSAVCRADKEHVLPGSEERSLVTDRRPRCAPFDPAARFLKHPAGAVSGDPPPPSPSPGEAPPRTCTLTARQTEEEGTGLGQRDTVTDPHAKGATEGAVWDEYTPGCTSALKDNRQFTPAQRDLEEFTPAQRDIKQFTPAQRDIEQFTPAQRDLEEFTPAQRDIKQFTPAQRDLEEFTPAQRDIEQFTPAQRHIKQFTPAQRDIKQFTPAQRDIEQFTPAQRDISPSQQLPAVTDQRIQNVSLPSAGLAQSPLHSPLTTPTPPPPPSLLLTCEGRVPNTQQQPAQLLLLQLPPAPDPAHPVTRWVQRLEQGPVVKIPGSGGGNHWTQVEQRSNSVVVEDVGKQREERAAVCVTVSQGAAAAVRKPSPPETVTQEGGGEGGRRRSGALHPTHPTTTHHHHHYHHHLPRGRGGQQQQQQQQQQHRLASGGSEKANGGIAISSPVFSAEGEEPACCPPVAGEEENKAGRRGGGKLTLCSVGKNCPGLGSGASGGKGSVCKCERAGEGRTRSASCVQLDRTTWADTVSGGGGGGGAVTPVVHSPFVSSHQTGRVIDCSVTGGSSQTGRVIDSSVTGGSSQTGRVIDCSVTGGSSQTGRVIDSSVTGGSSQTGRVIDCSVTGGSSQTGRIIDNSVTGGSSQTGRSIDCSVTGDSSQTGRIIDNSVTGGSSQTDRIIDNSVTGGSSQTDKLIDNRATIDSAAKRVGNTTFAYRAVTSQDGVSRVFSCHVGPPPKGCSVLTGREDRARDEEKTEREDKARDEEKTEREDKARDEEKTERENKEQRHEEKTEREDKEQRHEEKTEREDKEQRHEEKTEREDKVQRHEEKTEREDKERGQSAAHSPAAVTTCFPPSTSCQQTCSSCCPNEYSPRFIHAVNCSLPHHHHHHHRISTTTTTTTTPALTSRGSAPALPEACQQTGAAQPAVSAQPSSPPPPLVGGLLHALPGNPHASRLVSSLGERERPSPQNTPAGKVGHPHHAQHAPHHKDIRLADHSAEFLLLPPVREVGASTDVTKDHCEGRGGEDSFVSGTATAREGGQQSGREEQRTDTKPTQQQALLFPDQCRGQGQSHPLLDASFPAPTNSAHRPVVIAPADTCRYTHVWLSSTLSTPEDPCREGRKTSVMAGSGQNNSPSASFSLLDSLQQQLSFLSSDDTLNTSDSQVCGEVSWYTDHAEASLPRVSRADDRGSLVQDSGNVSFTSQTTQWQRHTAQVSRSAFSSFDGRDTDPGEWNADHVSSHGSLASETRQEASFRHGRVSQIVSAWGNTFSAGGDGEGSGRSGFRDQDYNSPLSSFQSIAWQPPASSSEQEDSDGNYTSVSSTESSHYNSHSEIEYLNSDNEREDYDNVDSFNEFVCGLQGQSTSDRPSSHYRTDLVTSEFRASRLRSCIQETIVEADDESETADEADTTTTSVSSYRSTFHCSLPQSTPRQQVPEIRLWDSDQHVTHVSPAEDGPLTSSVHLLQDLSDRLSSFSDASFELHTLQDSYFADDVSESRHSACSSPAPSDVSEGSWYSTSATAEVRKQAEPSARFMLAEQSQTVEVKHSADLTSHIRLAEYSHQTAEVKQQAELTARFKPTESSHEEVRKQAESSARLKTVQSSRTAEDKKETELTARSKLATASQTTVARRQTELTALSKTVQSSQTAEVKKQTELTARSKLASSSETTEIRGRAELTARSKMVQSSQTAKTSQTELTTRLKVAGSSQNRSLTRRNLTPVFQHEASKRAKWIEDNVLLFQKLLNDFSSQCKTTEQVLMEEMMSFDCGRDGDAVSVEETEPTSCGDLYHSFTQETLEKRQSHVCPFVEDHLPVIRFKRFLKKQHNSKLNGRKIFRVRHRLGKLSESPATCAARAQKAVDDWHGTGPSDMHVSWIKNSPLPPPKPSSSFKQQQHIVVLTDHTNVTRSLSDSAYSTTSDATSRHVSDLDSVAMSVGSSRGDDVSSITTDGSLDSDKLASLNDVFEQLDVCEGEIDLALLDRLQVGHYKADTL